MNSNQEKRGMNGGLSLSLGSKKTGITVNRNPHATGNIASSGSGRAETHDNGNRQAINSAKQKIAQKLEAPLFHQPSQVRSLVKKINAANSASPRIDAKSLAAEQKNQSVMLKNQGRKKKEEFDPFKMGNPNHQSVPGRKKR